MTRKKQSYSKEFKAEAVRTHLSHTGIYRALLQPSAPSLTAGEYLSGSVQEKVSSDGCLKKEQMAVSAIVSTPQGNYRLAGASSIMAAQSHRIRLILP